MKKLLTFLVSMICVVPCLGQRICAYNPIPVPQEVTLTDAEPFVLDNSVSIVCRGFNAQMRYNADYLQAYLKDVCNLNLHIGTTGSKSIVLIRKNNKKQSNEAYTIKIDKRSVVIEGNGDAGVFYGIQTLCQSIASTQVDVQNEPAVTLPSVKITDAPRFKYRGFMLDFSRHFFGKEFVMKQIDAMAHYKLNRLHLHLTDAGGWRLEMKSHPELTQKTAYRTQSNWRHWWDDGKDRQYCDIGTPDAYGGYFTQDDMREIIDYATKHQITVIPEIEMPGHSEEVLYTRPDLSCTNNFRTTGDFCIGNDAVFDYFTEILKEVSELFPSEYIHIGGDEAGKQAWKTCPKCQERIKKEGLDGVDGLQSWFIHRIEEIVNGMGKKIIGWDEILEGGLTPGATVMSWRGESGGIKAAESGHHVIMTPGNPLYLDMYQDAPPFCPEAQGGYYPLNVIYAYDPIGRIAPEAAHLVDGLQGNLWTERVETEEHVEYMMWPRLLAISEIGWSPTDRKDYDDFHKRALREVARLEADGYHPFDLKNAVGDRREYVIPIKHLALGKKVNYLIPYNSSYVAAGETTLTDGLRGNWIYGDGRWQGFIGRKGCVDVVIDLEQETEIHEVYAYFMQMVGPGVFYPGMVEISISNDGENFETIKHLTYVTNRDEPHGFRDFSWAGTAKARYVRYKANSGATGGWLFTDEIIVK